jgi:valyl-tRNA synthetase
MMMMGNHLIKKSPFAKVYVHALVRDEKGQKMSKSKGNVIDPLVLIDKYGADSLRFTLISMAAPGRDVKLSEDRVKGYRNFLNKIWNSNKFSQINKCRFNKNINIKKIKLDINKWIYFELIKTNINAQKNILNFRFDEAARIIYQFVWHSYCDWYIEFLKPIFDSKDQKKLKEARNFAAYIHSQILIMLHPFIPFFTEKIWLDLKLDAALKSPLMNKDWILPVKKINLYKKSYKKIDWIIELITNIRSTKADLEISPGSYIDISIEEIKDDKKDIVNDNLILLKRLGRIINIHKSSIGKSGINIIVGSESVTLYFNEDINLTDQKLKISNKVKNLESKVFGLKKKLENKSFLKKAPKNIVQKEKKSLLQYNIELKKLNSILNSIKN